MMDNEDLIDALQSDLHQLTVQRDALLAACRVAVAALEYVEQHYLPSSSAAAEMWAFVNGYEGSPDIRAIVAQAEEE